MVLNNSRGDEGSDLSWSGKKVAPAPSDVAVHPEYLLKNLQELERLVLFNRWMADTLKPFVGERVLEIGAGMGTLTEQLIPRRLYVATDFDLEYVRCLQERAEGRPYLRVAELDAGNHHHFSALGAKFDTALMLNVLEHVEDESAALINLRSVLDAKGKAIILVPQGPALYGTIDEIAGHYRRYTKAMLQNTLEQAGFHVTHLIDFNRFSVPGWWLNGKILKRRVLVRSHLRVFDAVVPLVKRLDQRLPWGGLSLIAVGEKLSPS